MGLGRNLTVARIFQEILMDASAGKSVRGRLFVMMVLQFFVWGAWLPPLFHLMGAPEGLNFTGTQQALIGSCFAIASVIGI